MHSNKIRMTLAALAAIGACSTATTGIAAARAPVHRPGQGVAVHQPKPRVVYLKGASTGDPGSASDDQCAQIADGINSWQNAAVGAWESNHFNITDEVSHDLKNANDLKNDGMDQGCFFYDE